MVLKLTPAEKVERAELHKALTEYHATSGKYLLPEKGKDGHWHLKPFALPPIAPSGYTGAIPGPKIP